MRLPGHLPGPLRAAVGLAATAADEAKQLPHRAIELPMLAVSTALQLSLRAQQRYAQLTARGDEVLQRPAGDEPPEWATFDDDAGAATGAEAGIAMAADLTRDDPLLADPLLGEPPTTTLFVPAPSETSVTDAEPAEAGDQRPASPLTATDSPAKKTAGKDVSAPRHTAPSRFDTVGDE